jgi:hypothetical protein
MHPEPLTAERHSRRLRQSFSAPATDGAGESRGVSVVCGGADSAKRKSLSLRRFVLALEVVEVLQIVGSVSEANERKPECGHSYALPVPTHGPAPATPHRQALFLISGIFCGGSLYNCHTMLALVGVGKSGARMIIA